MKKWIYVGLAIAIVAASIITGIILSNDDSSFVFNISAITMEVNSSKKIEYKSSDTCDVEFEIENEEIATISQNKITAHKIGQTYLNAEIKHQDKIYYRQAKVTVVAEEPAFHFNYLDTRNILLGDNTSFAPTITKGNPNVKYSVSDSSIATIGSDGIINSIKCGELDVNVLVDNTLVKTCHVTITANFTIEAESNCSVINENEISVENGLQAAFTVYIRNHNGENLITNFNPTLTPSPGINAFTLYSQIKFEASTSGSIMIYFAYLDATLIVNINVI